MSRSHSPHVWRDTAPFDRAGRLTAFVEIPRGDRRKFEFDMGENQVRIDRVMPGDLAYRVNYGFVPQTVSYDGDPFDVLVLGPPLEPGAWGTIQEGAAFVRRTHAFFSGARNAPCWRRFGEHPVEEDDCPERLG